MKRSEAILKISEKLQKQIHLINSDIQRNNPKMLCDNLALRIMSEIENIGMLPPAKKEPCFCSMRGTCRTCSPNLYMTYWEKEDE